MRTPPPGHHPGVRVRTELDGEVSTRTRQRRRKLRAEGAEGADVDVDRPGALFLTSWRIVRPFAGPADARGPEPKAEAPGRLATGLVGVSAAETAGAEAQRMPVISESCCSFRRSSCRRGARQWAPELNRGIYMNSLERDIFIHSN